MPPETDLSTVTILLSVCVGLLLLMLLVGLASGGRLKKIERLLAVRKQPSAPIPAPLAPETSSGGTFETFLSQNPELKLLSKKEQSAAYREWRRNNGMNWSNS